MMNNNKVCDNEIRENNRKEILSLLESNYNNEIKDMWQVVIVYLNAFGRYEVSKAFFDSRRDAEEWHFKKVENKPYYSFCCNDNFWGSVDNLLDKNPLK